MSVKFNSIRYLRGLNELSFPEEVTLDVDEEFRRVILTNHKIGAAINFEDITDVCIIDKNTRSEDESEEGAYIGGMLTGKIKLISTLSNRVTKSHVVLVCITHKKAGYPMKALLKAKGQTRKLHSALSSAVFTEVPPKFNFKRPPVQTEKLAKISRGGQIVLFVMLVCLFLLLRSCLASAN